MTINLGSLGDITSPSHSRRVRQEIASVAYGRPVVSDLLTNYALTEVLGLPYDSLEDLKADLEELKELRSNLL